MQEYPVRLDWIKGIPQEPYRNGVGAWEMVVMHYTDNANDTAEGEQTWEEQNWQNAFVHEFIDPNEIVQSANPEYEAWGAGPKANPRAIHLELCSAHTQEDFDRSFDMWCQRAAKYLSERNLGVSSAQPDGSGTLWGHFQVTKYLGGTTHEDPIDYLEKWGVSWDDVIARVQQHYDFFTEPATDFSDVDANRWSYPDIHVVASKDYRFMTGFEDGTFRPEEALTREQKASILNDLIYWVRHTLAPNDPQPGVNPAAFPDVPSDRWSAKCIGVVASVQYGFMKGFEDGTFRPEEPLTREQLASVLNDVVYWVLHSIDGGLPAPTIEVTSFTDVAKDRWSANVIYLAVSYGFLDGFEDGTFRPEESVTREQEAAVLNRFISWIEHA